MQSSGGILTSLLCKMDYKDKRTRRENIKERNKRENRKEQWHEQH